MRRANSEASRAQRQSAVPRKNRPLDRPAASQRPRAAVSAPRAPLAREHAAAPAAKLHKVLAQAGLGSRLRMEEYIAQGRVQVNGQTAHVGQRVRAHDAIRIDGKPLHAPQRQQTADALPRVLAYHKPAGELVTHSDPQGRATVFAHLPRLATGKWQAVGRLDMNTEGLLLLTDSGALAHALMHPRFGLEREYAVRVIGALGEVQKRRLLAGVLLDDGPAAFTTLQEAGGGKDAGGINCWYRATIQEGRHREVRRMFAAAGHTVSRLIRVRYGAMLLPRGLARGAWLELDRADVQALLAAAHMATDATPAVRPAAAAAKIPPGGNPARIGADSLQRARRNARQAQKAGKAARTFHAGHTRPGTSGK